jgi:hypothetical protein
VIGLRWDEKEVDWQTTMSVSAFLLELLQIHRLSADESAVAIEIEKDDVLHLLMILESDFEKM